MKKLNKKGFVLVETLIVTVFVVSMFIIVYQATVPVIGDFEQYNKYEDINTIYAANLYRQMLVKYGNLNNINKQFETSTYVDISNCNNTDIYLSKEYCNLLKKSLGIVDDDIILLTEYDISAFKNEVSSNVDFDSGSYSNFRDYVNTVSNTELLSDTNVKKGKYRIFIIKNIVNSDKSKSRKYANLGVYDGDNSSFLMGETVFVDLKGEGTTKFYVLKNSDSFDDTVTLISSKNIINSNVAFPSDPSNNTLLDSLTERTADWNTAVGFANFKYYSRLDDYVFDYTNSKARFLDEYDIYELLGCKKDKEVCFDPDNAFAVEFDTDKLGFLVDNLADGEGYWTATTVSNTGMYAWSIQKGKIVPTRIDDNLHIGLRPVIIVNKRNVSRG